MKHIHILFYFIYLFIYLFFHILFFNLEVEATL